MYRDEKMMENLGIIGWVVFGLIALTVYIFYKLPPWGRILFVCLPFIITLGKTHW